MSETSFAGAITKVKKGRFIFKLGNLKNDIKKGTSVVVEASSGRKIRALILKKGKTVALAKLVDIRQAKVIKVGDDVGLFKAVVKEEEMISFDEQEDPKVEKDSTAKATGNGFYLEPYANILFGSFSQPITSTSASVTSGDNKGKATGVNLGALLGYKYQKFYFAPLFSASLGSYKTEAATSSSSSTTSNAFGKNTLGIYLGYQGWTGFKLFLTLAKVSFAVTSDTAGKTLYSGTGFSFGGSVSITESLYANLSLALSSYGTEDDKSLPITTLGVTREAVKETSALIGLSYLFSFYD